MRLMAIFAAGLLLQGCMANREPVASAPQSAGVIRKQLSNALEANDRAALTRSAITLARMGGSLSEASIDRIAPLLDPAILADQSNWWGETSGAEGVFRLRRSFRENGEVRTPDPGDVVATVPAEYRLVEGIAWDEKAQRLFIGTVVDGRLAYLEKGAWIEVPIGSPRGGLFGMAVDAKRRLLWIATGSVEQTAVEGPRMTGLIAVDLDTLKVVRRVPVFGDTPGVVGDLAVRADGTVFASNSVTGAIHRCKPGCKALEDLVPAGRFKSPQGLALSRGGSRLYVADYPDGLSMIVTRTGEVVPVKLQWPSMLDGIDGLVATHALSFGSGDRLSAVQNGTRPRRILSISIGPEPDLIVDVSAMHSISPDGPEPTLGTVRDSDLLYIGDGQWERYGPGGVLKDGQPPRPTPILRQDLIGIVIT